MSDTILVTGGAGFVGSNVCDALLSAGHTVISLDNLGTGRTENFDLIQDSVRGSHVDGDVCEAIGDQLRSAQVNPDTIDSVYHLASRASPVDFNRYPLQIARTNSHGTQNVLEFAREVDARVLYASTSEVYGDPEVHPQSESYTGNVNLRGPRACYDVSKRYGEMLTSVYHRQYSVDVRTVRIFNTYGPKMRPNDGRVIPTFLTQALDGRDLTVYGDGTQTRSFLYIDDLVKGLQALMNTAGLDGDVVNIGSTDEITINELANHVREVVGTDVGITYEPLPHEDEPEKRRPDISRAKQKLGWEAATDLTDGLRRTAQYFRD